MITPSSSFVIVVSFIVVCFFTTCSVQPFEDIHFASTHRKRYDFVINFKLTWQQAVEYCRSQGMFLVSIHNQEQFEAVQKAIDNSGYWRSHQTLDMWTSLNDIGEEGHYYWASTGVRNTFEGWRDGEPNNVGYDECTDEDCVALIKQNDSYFPYGRRESERDILPPGLDDRPCTEKYYFMCETMDC